MRVSSRTLLVPAALMLAMLAQAKNPANESIEHKVHHQLAMLPYVNVFDDLSFRVDGSKVTLFGEVTRPILKSDAQHAVERVEGVTGVDNQIEVLPLSTMDDQIRMSEFRSIFSYAPLQRYRAGVIPSIHIIVKNGNVTLMGVVSNQGDKQMAYMRANGVPGVFSVTNQLQVEK